MHPAAAAIPHRWSTDDVPPAQRLDYWVGAISEGFLAMDASSPVGQAFCGELVSASLGPVGVNRVTGDAQQVWRTSRGIARSRDNFCYLLGNLASAWRVEQDGRRTLLAAGDFTLVDSRRPYHFDFPEGPSTVSLELPLEWVARWLAEPEAHVARAFRATEPGWGAALAAFARPWDPAMACAPPMPASLLTDQLGSLLALACGEATEHSVARPELAERVAAQLRERLSEPGLTASDVAVSLGVSVRSLHRAMAANGQTFAHQLVAHRMEEASRMLRNPALHRLTTAEIGRRVGLLDPSHFVRLFRQHLGETPVAFRQRH
jgi:AraC family transcriptional regulator, positive regulator of tynA and feaB